MKNLVESINVIHTTLAFMIKILQRRVGTGNEVDVNQAQDPFLTANHQLKVQDRIPGKLRIYLGMDRVENLVITGQ